MTPQERLLAALQYQRPSLGDVVPVAGVDNAPTASQGGGWDFGLPSWQDVKQTGSDALTGLSRLPYRAAGAPVDLMNMVSGAFGVGDEKPVGGSDWMIDKAIQGGVASPRTGSIAESTGDFASGFLDPSVMGPKLAAMLGKGGAAAAAFLPTRPKMPAAVGTRYAARDIGGLLPEKPFNIEDYMGASIGVMPWDNSSRNRLITNVSEVELKNPVLTHGGQAYARDIAHQKGNIAGASAPVIVNRIRDRVNQARAENLAQGGTGEILQTPATMSEGAENYSVTPSQILLDLIEQRNPSKAKIKDINRSIQSEYPTFSGIETDAGRAQLMSGGGGISAPAQLRKKFVASMYNEPNQQYFGFNRQDIANSILDPSLLGVGRGYGLNTVISHKKDPLTITKSKNPTYATDFSGKYVGTAGNVLVKEFMPDAYGSIFRELSGRTDKTGKVISPSAVHDQTIGALQTRGSNAYQLINQQLVDALMKRRELAAQRGIQ
jgi:hypothetical protein